MQKFTVFIADQQREGNDPLITSVECAGAMSLSVAAAKAYNQHYGCNGLMGEDHFAENGAVIIGACTGEIDFAWNPEGLSASEFAASVLSGVLKNAMTSVPAWNTLNRPREHLLQHECAKNERIPLPRHASMLKPLMDNTTAAHKFMIEAYGSLLVPEDAALDTLTMIADIKQSVQTKARFPEVDKMPIISTAHVSTETLRTLDSLEINRALPYWIVSTEFGYIVRFESAIGNWEAGLESEPELMHPFKEAGLNDTFSALCAELAQWGFNGVHLDSDGNEIEGLQTYEHD